jgi:hypothetical protein
MDVLTKKYMYRAPQKFGIKTNKKEMVDCLWEIAETAV